MTRFYIMIGSVGFVLCGCATSDDPRQGGLFGYWATGEAGYEKRLEEKRESLETMQEQTRIADDRTASLEAERDQRAAQVQEATALLTSLDEELSALEQTTASLQLDTELQHEQRAELQQEMDNVQDQLKTIRNFPLDETQESAIQDRRRKLGELQKELRVLRERASLLTTL